MEPSGLTSMEEEVMSRARSLLLVLGTLVLLVTASGSSAWAKVEEDMKNFESHNEPDYVAAPFPTEGL